VGPFVDTPIFGLLKITSTFLWWPVFLLIWMDVDVDLGRETGAREYKYVYGDVYPAISCTYAHLSRTIFP